MAPSDVFPGVSAPLGAITKTDQSGLIAVMTAMAMVFVVVSYFIRGYVRFEMRSWKLDDNILTAATVLSLVQTAMVFYEIHHGLGRSEGKLDQENLSKMLKAYYANNILYILVLFLSKTSLACLYLRLTVRREHLTTVYSVIGASCIWAVMSILLVTVECSWRSGCTKEFSRWQTIGAIDIITEVALFAMSIYLVEGLQMAFKRKAIVVAAFATRLLVIIPCAFRLYYLSPTTLPHNRTLASSLLTIITQLQLGYGIMAATIPCLKPFIAVYEAPAKPYAWNSGSNSNSRNNSNHPNPSRSGASATAFKLSSLVSARSLRPESRGRSHSADLVTAASSGGGGGGGGLFVPRGKSAYRATVSSEEQANTGTGILSKNNSRSASVYSHGSEKMIIERKTDWSVRSGEGDGAVVGGYTHQHENGDADSS